MVAARRSRILVVDDCADTVESMSTMLELLGHETRSARTGADALAQACAFDPDLVLLDLVLPDISGYQVAPQLRARSARVYVAAFTGRGMAHDRERTRAAGFDAHLLKPVPHARLCAVITASRAPRVP